jgi:hypothetical protein
VEIVSRDRSSEYAAAIRKGAPQALQVADRWHIGKNLADSVQTLLARCRAEIRRGLQVQAMPEQEREETESVPEEERHPPRGRLVQLAREGRRAQKLDRYTQVVELHHQGLRAADIASHVGIGERTVHRWLRNGAVCRLARRTSDYPDGNRTGLGRSDAPLCHHPPWRDPTDDDHQRSRRSRLWSLPAQSHHGEGRRSRDHRRITGILALSPARLPVVASQADARTLDATGHPTPGAGVAGASQLWLGQVLCPDGKAGGL